MSILTSSASLLLIPSARQGISYSLASAFLVVWILACVSFVTIELLAVSHQSNNRETKRGLLFLPLHIERARPKNLAFFIDIILIYSIVIK
jgi:hypothetical protein